MPKEYIHNAYFGQAAREVIVSEDGKTGETRDVLIDSSVVKIGWTRGGMHCEIAVLEDPDANDPESGARHSQLDRVGINRLIRTLRKARDQAFGADA